MKIFILPSSVHCLNLGDVAMMEVTCRRFRNFWPDAQIYVLNDAPELLELYCPKAIPVRPIGQQAYYTTVAYLSRIGRRFASPAISELDYTWRHNWPGLAEKLVTARSGERAGAEVRNFLDLVRSCDLVMASGAGQITTVAYQTYFLPHQVLESASQREDALARSVAERFKLQQDSVNSLQPGCVEPAQVLSAA